MSKRIAWFSPIFSAVLSRAVEYTRAVLENLPEDWELELFVGDEDYRRLLEESALEGDSQPSSCIYLGVPVYHYLHAFLRDKERSFSAAVYQLENLPECAFVAQMGHLFPGVTVFHDLTFGNIDDVLLSHASTGEALNRKISEEHGEGAVPLGDWRERGWSTEVIERNYPQGTGLFYRANLAAVFDDRSSGYLEDLQISAPVAQISFPLSCREAVYWQATGKEKRFRVVYAGKNLFEDRIFTFFAGISRLLADCPGSDLEVVWLVDSEKSRLACEKRLRSLGEEFPGLERFVRILQFATKEELYEELLQASCFVGIKFDLLRALPLPLIAALRLGVPSIVTDFGPGGEIADGAVLKVPPGIAEEKFVVQCLKALMNSPELSRSLSLAARDYADSLLSVSAAMSDLDAVFRLHDEYLEESMSNYRMKLDHLKRGFALPEAAMSAGSEDGYGV